MNRTIEAQHKKEFAFVTMRIPALSVDKAKKTIAETLQSAGIPVSFAPGEKFEESRTYSFEEVFPDHNPGHALAGLRHREGLTQRQMAAALGISQARLSEYERDKRRITIDMAKRIAAKYGVSYKSLL